MLIVLIASALSSPPLSPYILQQMCQRNIVCQAVSFVCHIVRNKASHHFLAIHRTT